jgi:hypothetical protein
MTRWVDSRECQAKESVVEMVKMIGQPYDALGNAFYRALTNPLLVSITACGQGAPDEPAATSAAGSGSTVSEREALF